MPDHPPSLLAAAYAAEAVLFLAGLVVWWRVLRRPPLLRLPRWQISPSDFLVSTFIVVGVGFLFLLLVQASLEPLLRKNGTDDTRTVLYSAALEFGLLAGVIGAGVYQRVQRITDANPPPAKAMASPLLLAGLLTYLAVRPASDLGGLAFEQLLQAAGLPSPPQEQIEVFMRLKSPGLFASFFILATVIAPVSEELVFRAGLFRYLRTRLPGWAALLLPSLLFALLHMDWKTLGGLASLAPLTILAVVFSLAYERTGRIAPVMIAHSLFNLSNILFLLAGMRA